MLFIAEDCADVSRYCFWEVIEEYRTDCCYIISFAIMHPSNVLAGVQYNLKQTDNANQEG